MRAHNSTTLLELCPIFLARMWQRNPWLSRKETPKTTELWLPFEALSKFNLMNPEGGRCHLFGILWTRRQGWGRSTDREIHRSHWFKMACSLPSHFISSVPHFFFLIVSTMLWWILGQIAVQGAESEWKIILLCFF